ncbi:Sad1/UNC-like domain-containing protein [Hamiltosporidium magnivora]|uniref:Sad1/UNC-like domain-containing protein n=1 Tax=Hamiltosporidium magnivora TaxID=148818 RepID=A0A4Q9LIG6_9MICR|nr:Sad1/UNC-like domain-containing protein [Hamiltosporidium magnivora]
MFKNKYDTKGMSIYRFLYMYISVISAKGCNYASNICGSFILMSSDHIKRAETILNTKNDNYLMGKCKESFIIVRLCDEIKIKLIILQNLEWQASFPKSVKFSILNNQNWYEIGTFELLKKRSPQSFTLNSPHFSNILKIEILDFNGKFDIFTLSSLKVFGTTMMEDFKEKEFIKTQGMNLYDIFSSKIIKLEKYNELKENFIVFELEKQFLHLKKVVYKLKNCVLLILLLLLLSLIFILIRKI